MTAQDVANLYRDLQSIGVPIWIDGGWAVDALLGRQTRPHDDLDIAIEEKNVAAARAFLESKGFRDLPERFESQWNFVYGDTHGRVVDFHSFVRDASGEIIEGIKYPPGSLTGIGSIDGQPVNCIAAAHLVKFHTGYALRETDRHDVKLLCEKFGIELPEEYRS